MSAPREKSSFRLPPGLLRQLDGAARAKGVARTAILEAALMSYLTPDAAERLEATLARRLDRHTRQLDTLRWHVELTNETLALFIRFWLTTNPPLPETAMKAAQAMGKERWERFVDSLGRRMTSGSRLRDELSENFGGKEGSK